MAPWVVWPYVLVMELLPLSSKFTLFAYFMKTNLGLLNICPLPEGTVLSFVILENGRDLASVLSWFQ